MGSSPGGVYQGCGVWTAAAALASSEAVRAAARLHVKVHHAALEHLPLAG